MAIEAYCTVFSLRFHIDRRNMGLMTCGSDLMRRVHIFRNWQGVAAREWDPKQKGWRGEVEVRAHSGRIGGEKECVGGEEIFYLDPRRAVV